MARYLNIPLIVAGIGAVIAELTYRAALVQGANQRIAWIGLIIGCLVGLLIAIRKTSFTFVVALLGTLGSLQLFTCYPDDCSNIIMPILGFGLGAFIGACCDDFSARRNRSQS